MFLSLQNLIKLIATHIYNHIHPFKICVRLMGRSNAMELLCFGKRINAEDAKKRNLVTSILPHQNFQEYIQVS